MSDVHKPKNILLHTLRRFHQSHKFRPKTYNQKFDFKLTGMGSMLCVDINVIPRLQRQIPFVQQLVALAWELIENLHLLFNSRDQVFTFNIVVSRKSFI